MGKVHLIMPMGGEGSRFSKLGFDMPKPLIEIKGHPFLYWATNSIAKYVDIEDITFVVLKNHIELYRIDKIILQYYPEAHIEMIDHVLPGPVFTCLEGIKNITDGLPILINDCDHMFRCEEINDLLNRGFPYDGGLLTFKSDQPQFSYVQYDEEQNIIGTIEKKVVSNRAICGAYLFKSADLFRSIAKVYTENCPYKECFLSGMYNVMCKESFVIKDYLLDYHVEFGTPDEYKAALNSEHFY